MVEMLTEVNWETVIVAAIVPLITLLGVIYKTMQDRKAAREGADLNLVSKREPSWVELAEENRKLREEMEGNKADADERFRKLEERFESFVTKTNTRIGALSNMLHAASSQWPSDTAGPYFSQADLDALENTDVPYVWRNRVRPHP